MSTKLSVISDHHYSKSSWYYEMLGGLRKSAQAARMSDAVDIITSPVDQIDLDALSDVVVVTNGNSLYLKKTISTLISSGHHLLLADTYLVSDSNAVSKVHFSIRAEVQRLVRYLRSHGREKIALVGFGKNSANDMGVYNEAVSAIFSVSDGSSILGEQDIAFLWDENIMEGIFDFMENIDKFDAAICPNDVVGIILCNTCRERGICIPENLFVASMCGMKVGQLYEPSITTISKDYFYLGQEIFNIWNYMSRLKKPRPSISETIRGRLLIGKSTAYSPESLDINAGLLSVSPDNYMETYQRHLFFSNPVVAPHMSIEMALQDCDGIDLHITQMILEGKSYEQICDALFISSSTLKYRTRKIFANLDATSRKQFEQKIRDGLNIQGIPSYTSEA